jgi:hypothetical protein
MNDESDPRQHPASVVGVPAETPEAVRPSATGLVVDPSAEEDEAAIEAGGRVVGATESGEPEIEGPNSE